MQVINKNNKLYFPELLLFKDINIYKLFEYKEEFIIC